MIRGLGLRVGSGEPTELMFWLAVVMCEVRRALMSAFAGACASGKSRGKRDLLRSKRDLPEAEVKKRPNVKAKTPTEKQKRHTKKQM